jgi:hypothetical protein
LLQLSRSTISDLCLATHGRAIHCGTTRPCCPLARRAAYCGNAAFLGVLRVSAVSPQISKLSTLAKATQRQAIGTAPNAKTFFTNPSTGATDIP